LRGNWKVAADGPVSKIPHLVTISFVLKSRQGVGKGKKQWTPEKYNLRRFSPLFLTVLKILLKSR
jgi:hypothetical protein